MIFNGKFDDKSYEFEAVKEDGKFLIKWEDKSVDVESSVLIGNSLLLNDEIYITDLTDSDAIRYIERNSKFNVGKEISKKRGFFEIFICIWMFIVFPSLSIYVVFSSQHILFKLVEIIFILLLTREANIYVNSYVTSFMFIVSNMLYVKTPKYVHLIDLNTIEDISRNRGELSIVAKTKRIRYDGDITSTGGLNINDMFEIGYDKSFSH